MAESIINVQAFLADIEAEVDAALATQLTSKFGDVQVEFMDNIQNAQRQFRISMPQETGAVLIGNPYKLKVFVGQNEAHGKGFVDAWVAAHPSYFVSQVQFKYSFQSPLQPQRVMFFLIYNESLADGEQNWAGAGGSGGGGGGSDGLPSWTLIAATGDADPGSGNFGINNADHTLATFLYISDISDSGTDLSTFLSTLQAGDQSYFEDVTEITAALLYAISGAAVDGSGYWKIPVTFTSQGSSAISNGSSCGFTFKVQSTATVPGGADTQIQFNNAGAFDGSPDLTFDHGVTNVLKAAEIPLVAGLDWRDCDTIVGQLFYDVAYGNGLWVAIAGNGVNRFYTSVDGKTWKPRGISDGIDQLAWRGITYGNGRFVAIQTGTSNSRSLWSIDGITWNTTFERSTVPSGWTSIAWGLGLFVAVGTGSVAQFCYSVDGEQWFTAISPVPLSDWQSVHFDNGIFMAVSSNNAPNNIATSVDGKTWVIAGATPADFIVGWDITFGRDFWITAGFGDTQLIVSNDNGATWTAPTIPVFATTIYSVVYAGGLFIAMNSASNFITSRDTINWTLRDGGSGATNSLRGLMYARGLVVGVGQDNGTGANLIASGNFQPLTQQLSSNDDKYLRSMIAGQRVVGAGKELIAGIEWETVTGIPTRGVCWGNGLFVAVGGGVANEKAATSPDGKRWIRHATPSNADFQSVAFGNGRFVAVSDSTIMYSDNGVDWFNVTGSDNPEIGSNWASVTYGEGVFVMVGDSSGVGSRVATSPNGVQWTSRTSTFDNNWQGVAHDGFNRFIAVASSGPGALIMTSTDGGITWSSIAAPVAESWKSVAYGNGVWVAVANNGSGEQVMYSTNGGTNWAEGDSSEVSEGPVSSGGVAYGNGIFAASGQRPYYSIDGINWFNATNYVSNSGSWAEITYHNGMFVMVGTLGSISAAISGNLNSNEKTVNSPNIQNGDFEFRGDVDHTEPVRIVDNDVQAGLDWELIATPADNNWSATAYGGGIFVAVSTNGTNRAMYSLDGKIWELSLVSSQNWIDVIFANGLFVAVANGGVSVGAMISLDGINWELITAPVTNEWQSIGYGFGLFVAVSSTGTGDRVMTSPDGRVWETQISAADISWKGIIFGNGLFVAVAISGVGNRVMTSPDAVTWTIRTSAADQGWQDVAYGKGLYVAVSSDGTTQQVMTSPDGITWSLQDTPQTETWISVNYLDGLFVATAITGTTNRVMISSDGINWIMRATPANQLWNDTAFGNGLMVGVSSSGTGSRAMSSGVLKTQEYTGNPNVSVGSPEFKNAYLPARAVFAVSANTATLGWKTIYSCTDSSAPRTLTIQTADIQRATPENPWVFWVKDEGGQAFTNNITIATQGGELINGVAGPVLITSSYGQFGFYSDGSALWLLSAL